MKWDRWILVWWMVVGFAAIVGGIVILDNPVVMLLGVLLAAVCHGLCALLGRLDDKERP